MLVLALSVPFYGLGIVGARMPGMPFLPLSALMAVVPVTAALLLWPGGWSAAGSLFAKSWDFRGARTAPYVMALAFIPAICVAQFFILRAMGLRLPPPAPLLGETVFFALMFLAGAIGEELGWQAYAYPALRTRYSRLQAALIVGAVWAVWHIIPYAQLGRSAWWIAWHSLCAVAMRVIMVDLYEWAGRRVSVTVLFHAMINLSWALFPVAGSYYDPFLAFLLLGGAALLFEVAWRSARS